MKMKIYSKKYAFLDVYVSAFAILHIQCGVSLFLHAKFVVWVGGKVYMASVCELGWGARSMSV